MYRNGIALLAVLAGGSLGYAGAIHSMIPIGGGIGAADPNLVIDVWDVGITIVPPDFWTSTLLTATIDPGAASFAAFDPIQAGLDPPRNPVSGAAAFSNFLSTAKHFPNDLAFAGAPTFVSDVTAATPRLLQASWSSSDPADGAGPGFTLFRVAITRPRTSPALTLTPTSTLVATIAGESTTSEGGATPFAFAFSVYQVPEPGTFALVLVGCGTAAAYRRRR